MTEDEMAAWHHQLNGHESEQAPGDIEGQVSLVCCSSWGHKKLEKTLESPLDCKEIQPVHSEGDHS